MRILLLLGILLAGCTTDQRLQVVGPYADDPALLRSLRAWTAEFSTHPINHYFVGRTNRPEGLVQAFVYWKEERSLIEYQSLAGSEGAELLAFHHALKLDRDTVDTADDVAGSTYLVTHRQWLDWMEACLARGRPYEVILEARTASTNSQAKVTPAASK